MLGRARAMQGLQPAARQARQRAPRLSKADRALLERLEASLNLERLLCHCLRAFLQSCLVFAVCWKANRQ